VAGFGRNQPYPADAVGGFTPLASVGVTMAAGVLAVTPWLTRRGEVSALLD
jgi:hypothetical protein